MHMTLIEKREPYTPTNMAVSCHWVRHALWMDAADQRVAKMLFFVVVAADQICLCCEGASWQGIAHTLTAVGHS